jgi:hypothetical protein
VRCRSSCTDFRLCPMSVRRKTFSRKLRVGRSFLLHAIASQGTEIATWTVRAVTERHSRVSADNSPKDASKFRTPLAARSNLQVYRDILRGEAVIY